MTEAYFPFDSGAGANSYEDRWTKIMKAMTIANGYVPTIGNELYVYADSTGMQVKIKSGACWIMGHYWETDSEIIKSIGTADPSNPRWDRVVIRLDWTNNQITTSVVQGTPAANPSLPAITQSSTIWEISLATVRVNASVSTIAADKVYDGRISCFGVYEIECVVGNAVNTPATGPMPTGIKIPWPGRISAWHMTADTTGSIVIDIWKDTLPAYPPTVADTIISTGKPTLSSQRWNYGQVATSSGTVATCYWPGAVLTAPTDPFYLILSGHYLLLNVDSASTLKQVLLTLQVQKHPYWAGW